MSRPPKLLYHYTSIDAFKGIIDNKHLRMTKYDQLNDTSEVVLAKNLLIRKIKEYNNPSEYQGFKEYLLDGLKDFKDLNIYITSFSEKGNDLEQWRAYTPNGGIAIGFDFNDLKNGFFIDEHFCDRWPASLFRCLYIGKSTTEYIRKLIAEWFQPHCYAGMFVASQNNKTEWSKFIYALLNSTLSRSIYNLICTIKHDAYSNEIEWRWVNVKSKTANLKKELDGKNRKYVKGRIHPEDCIQQVWISPHGDKETIKRVLEFYKERNNLSFKIHESKIPYRL